MRLAAAIVAACCVGLAAPAQAAEEQGRSSQPGSSQADPDALVHPPTQESPPPGHRRSALQVLAIADRVPAVRAARRRHPGSSRAAYLKGATRWQVSYFGRRPPGRPDVERPEIAQVLIDDRTGAVLEAWTGPQVAWSMARGYPGAFGRKASASYVWIPLLVLFLVPFVDRRRLLSLRHLDLLVLCSFSISLAFFSHGKIGASVPLAYPPLLYLLVRMLVLARRRAAADGTDAGPRPFWLAVPRSWLVVGLVFLVAFRVGLNLVNSNVIDVGYAGVIGANRLAEGERLYGAFPADNEHGDTYGPVNYYAYVPWERLWPWTGRWDDLPAAHAAAVFFDALTMLLLWLLGRRIRGPDLGLALAYGWAAFPFTLFALASNSNDSLVAALLVAALLVADSPVKRGVVAALAGMTKFAPLALAALLALHDARGHGARAGARRVARFAGAFSITTAAVMAPVLLDGGASLFVERTLAYQGERDSPFSVWGLAGGLDGLRVGVQVAALLLAVVVAFLPRRRDVVTLAALAAAVLIAVQLGVSHWFYLYIPWFFPLVLVAVLAEDVSPPWRRAARSLRQPAGAGARSRPPASVATP